MAEVHLSDDDLAALQRAAEREDRAVEDVLHAAVVDYTSGWRRERDLLLDQILDEDAKLLRKLGAT